MDISNLGTECYEQFPRSVILQALSKAGGLESVVGDLERSHLNKKESEVAAERAQSRLECYYKHLQDLTSRIEHEDTRDAYTILEDHRRQDKALLEEFYRSLARESRLSGETTSEPGIAIFLQIGDRSIALLPGTRGNPASGDTVYMATRWLATALGGAVSDPVKLEEFRNMIERSNRLWQRERWWVLPASDTIEPFGRDARYNREKISEAVYFNDISKHKQGTDGRVDAFWGVQCGIRVALPIGHVERNTHLVILLTTFLPDAFKDWDEYNSKEQDEGRERAPYVKPIPSETTSKIVTILKDAFSAELKGLSFAASALQDVGSSEASLMEAAMKLLAHRSNHREQTLPWEQRVFYLIDRLSSLSPGLYEASRHLDSPGKYVVKCLENLSRDLPNTKNSLEWKKELKEITEGIDHRPVVIDTVGRLFESLKSWERSMGFKIALNSEAERHQGCCISIPPYLLSEIMVNLVEKSNVSIDLSVVKHAMACEAASSSARYSMNVTAFYHNWRLSENDEWDFLLKPIRATRNDTRSDMDGGTSSGFYLTAQLLWRYGGTIEYYRLESNNGKPKALISVSIPITGGR